MAEGWGIGPFQWQNMLPSWQPPVGPHGRDVQVPAPWQGNPAVQLPGWPDFSTGGAATGGGHGPGIPQQAPLPPPPGPAMPDVNLKAGPPSSPWMNAADGALWGLNPGIAAVKGIYDSVRGTDAQIQSDRAAAEAKAGVQAPDNSAAKKALVDWLSGPQAGPEANLPGNQVLNYDLGGTPMPLDDYRLHAAGAVKPGNYNALLGNIPAPERTQRQIAPGVDYTQSDKYMAESAPDDPEKISLWNGLMGGLSRAGLAASRGGGDVGDMLLALGSGALGGVSSARSQQEELDRAHSHEMDEYYGRMAGYESGKAAEQRSEHQQGFDSAYESDVDFRAQKAAYGGEKNQILSKGIDADYAYRQQAANAAATDKNYQVEAFRKWHEQFQPAASVDSQGRVIIKDRDPQTGSERIRVDNTNVATGIWGKAMAKSLSGGGHTGSTEFEKDFGDRPSGPQGMLFDASSRLASGGIGLIQQMLPEASEEITKMAAENNSMDPATQMKVLGNVTYATLMNMMDQNPERVLSILQMMGSGGG